MNNYDAHDDSLFYCDVEETDATAPFIKPLKEYSIANSKQVYIIKSALGTNKEYKYDLNHVAVILIPKHPILLLNYGKSTKEELYDYRLDFIEDLGYLSDKYNYNLILGRARKWPESLIIALDLEEFAIETYIEKTVVFQDQRKIDLLISLLIGSINSIDKVGLAEPESLLDKVKQKIILFDGQQSRFIYQTMDKSTVFIQGMAGTGKTELLLHKLKDVYAKDSNSVIAFTCFNKVLANDMKNRIPQFFNFMKVDEQIEWWSRLFVFSSWGSANQPLSGMYRYLCGKYQLSYSTYGENPDFNELCLRALDELNKKETIIPCFDYIFIDESQDFQDSFFQLCQKVVRKKVYIAGDIFQNIFDTDAKAEIKPDYLLNKCYRTDPKTLMFAHAIGMGLYEKPHLNWLDDDGWRSCGYTIRKTGTDSIVELSRSPLRRFEDLDASDTIRIMPCKENEYSNQILTCIDNIRCENPSVQPDDIAIIILGTYKTNFAIADEVAFKIQDKYNWDAVKGYVSKVKEKDKVFISNVNNIKGLEFPFVICIVPRIVKSNILFRNSMYMALTRSFLTSYLLLDEANSGFLSTYSEAATSIKNDGVMRVYEPTPAEKQEMENRIRITLIDEKKSFAEIIQGLLDEEYPSFDKEKKKLVFDTMYKFASDLPSDELKKRTRILIENVIND